MKDPTTIITTRIIVHQLGSHLVLF